MLAVQRRKATIELLARTDAVSVEDLSAQLEVSLSTVRRDLDELEAEGIVRRVHGGAVLVRPTEPDAPELSPDLREVEHAADKRAIAAAAVGLVNPGSVVLVTGGTTTAALLPLLASVHDLVIVTNSLDVATRLSTTDVDLMVLGGALRRPELSLLGHLVAAAIAELHIDHVITSAYGIDARSGILGASAQECETDRHLARSALRLTVLADASKFGRRSPHRIVGFDTVTDLVTTDDAPEADLTELRAHGVAVHVASATADTTPTRRRTRGTR